jgi:chromosome partitioning protein
LRRVIVVANQKGGVGKTTTVVNLGAALAELGKRVLLIDMDPQAALTATFGLDPYNMPRSIYSAMMHDNVALARILRPAGDTEMALAPGSVDLASAEVHLVKRADRAYRLDYILSRNRVPFDFVLIDTPPSLGLMTLNGLVAADEVLVPVQTQYLAMRGVRALMETVWRVKRRLNPKLRLLGLLPTMYRPDARHSVQVLRELRDVFGPKVFETVIEEDTSFAEAPVANQSLLAYDPDNAGAAAYRSVAEEIADGQSRR